METEFFLLRRLRRERRDFVVFLEVVGVALQAGYDLAYAWPQAVRDLQAELAPRLAEALKPPQEVAFPGYLRSLANAPCCRPYRLWLGVLAELYHSGAPLSAPLAALARSLREQGDREWQAHLRTLPLKTSLVMAVFFLLPALALIFVPLLTELAESFQ